MKATLLFNFLVNGRIKIVASDYMAYLLFNSFLFKISHPKTNLILLIHILILKEIHSF